MSNVNADIQSKIEIRRNYQWCIALAVPIVIILGWKFPILGYIFPLIVTSIIINSLLPGKGRYHCGNYCPRGAFYECLIKPISLKKGIPPLLRKWYFRGIPFLIVPSVITLKIINNPGYAWWEWIGHCCWILCTVTTVVGLPFSLYFGHRSWCSFCPLGSFQKLLDRKNNQMQIDSEKCVECGVCEETCPMHLPIMSYKDTGVMTHGDCIKCGDCVVACPQDVLSWPSDSKS